MLDDGSAQANTKTKRRREDELQAVSSSSKRLKTSKKNVDKSGIDSEELLLQTYPKEISNAKQSTGEEVSRSKRKIRPQKGTYSAKKWKDEEDVCLAMAMLESRPPGGKINIATYYKRAKEELEFEVSNIQLYEKMRRMRRRFRNIQKKLKEQNIEEDKFAFRTPHEPVLFMIWQQIWGLNNDILQFEGENPNSAEIVPENPKSKEIESEKSTSMDIAAESSKPMEIVAENLSSKEIEVENPHSMEIEAGNNNSMAIESGDPDPRRIVTRNPDPTEKPNPTRIKAENPNPKRVKAENPSLKRIKAKNPSRMRIKDENSSPRRIRPEKPNPRRNEAEIPCPRRNEAENLSPTEIVNPNPYEIDVANPKEGEAEVHYGANGDQSENHCMHKQQDEDGEENWAEEWKFCQESVSQETLAENASKNGRHQLLQGESRNLGINIQYMIDHTKSRLEDIIESSVSCINSAANFQPLGGFGRRLGMGNCVFLSVKRRMKELMDSVDFVEQFTGVNAAEARELQQKWHKIKIHKVKMFSEHLELLNDHCKLFLKSVHQQSLQESPCEETLAKISRQNGWHQMPQCENKELENNIQNMIENILSRLEAVIVSSVSHINASVVVNFQPLGWFGGAVEMGSSVFWSLSRTIKELMDGVNSVEEFPSLDAAESRELQQKWRQFKILKMKMFSKHLDLLNDRCKIFLKSVETSNGSHGV